MVAQEELGFAERPLPLEALERPPVVVALESRDARDGSEGAATTTACCGPKASAPAVERQPQRLATLLSHL